MFAAMVPTDDVTEVSGTPCKLPRQVTKVDCVRCPMSAQ
jgi:hypothetical protein